MKRLTGKEWFARLEEAFPGTLERVCRDSGLPFGEAMDEHVTQALDGFSAVTGGPELSPAMVGHARRVLGIVRRAALPRPMPTPPPEPQEALREIEDIATRERVDLEVRLVPEGDPLDLKVAEALERQLPAHFSRLSETLLRVLERKDVSHA